MTVGELNKAAETSATKLAPAALTDATSSTLSCYARLGGDAIQRETLCRANKLVRIAATTDVARGELPSKWVLLDILDALSTALARLCVLPVIAGHRYAGAKKRIDLSKSWVTVLALGPRVNQIAGADVHIRSDPVCLRGAVEDTDPLTTAGTLRGHPAGLLVTIAIRGDTAAGILVEADRTASALPGVLAFQVETRAPAAALQAILNAARRDAVLHKVNKSAGATAAIVARPSGGADAAVDLSDKRAGPVVPALIARITAQRGQADRQHKRHLQHYLLVAKFADL